MAEQMSEMQVLMTERMNSGTSWTKHKDFDRDGYFVIKNLCDPEELYHPVPELRGQLNYFDKNPENFIGGNHWLENLITLTIGSLQFKNNYSDEIYVYSIKNLQKEMLLGNRGN